ncbi:MAG TPA: SRPBCC family protein [Jatrophihabitans sp.]|jgi:uncharacterized protein YndB with AHSA1/START domain|nr:SRPBCC family protein [Jatrophihabitans sp.]
MTKEPLPGRGKERQLTTVERRIEAPVEQVFGTLADPWLIPVWVVGATHIRNVDAEWPAPHSRIHHQVGAWPLSISDSTAVVRYEEPSVLVLQGRAWPIGEVRIELTVQPDGAGSLVRMGEAPTYGTARILDNPLQRKLLAARNRESLARLAAVAENRRPVPAMPQR